MRSTTLILSDPDGTRKRLDAFLKQDSNGCLNFTGALRNGWGLIGVKLESGGYRYGWRAVNAHRVAWTLDRGPIPEGLVIDHLCGNRACCNVEHLEVVSQGENARRSAKPRMAACPRCGGTDFIETSAQRKCRPCWNAYFRQWQRDQKPPIQCPECGTEFQRSAESMKYCSEPCRGEARRRYSREWMRRYNARKRTHDGGAIA